MAALGPQGHAISIAKDRLYSDQVIAAREGQHATQGSSWEEIFEHLRKLTKTFKFRLAQERTLSSKRLH